jgi:glutamate--cysteine ligase
MPLCVQAAMVADREDLPGRQRLLLIPENHTRNLFYLQNVAALPTILRLTGLKVRIGSLLPDVAEPTARSAQTASAAARTAAPQRRSRAGRLRSLRRAAQQRPVAGVPPKC